MGTQKTKRQIETHRQPVTPDEQKENEQRIGEGDKKGKKTGGKGKGKKNKPSDDYEKEWNRLYGPISTGAIDGLVASLKSQDTIGVRPGDQDCPRCGIGLIAADEERCYCCGFKRVS